MNVKSIILQKLLVTFLIFGMVSQVVANKGEERTTFISKQAQEEFVTGTITDAATSETLLGVNVIIKKKDIGTSSDFDGQYKIQAKPGDVLEFSYVGYITKQVVVTKSNEVINIQLEESKGTLEEIIVVGYKKKQIKDITEAAVNINQVEELSTRPIINSEEILQGTASGVTVINDGGDPTKSPNIKIRGVGSLRKESPLIVVDGIPELPMPSPADIENISVLKDASASIYGARAAGGVILVTTKKGKKGKTSMNLNIYTGVQSVANNLETLNTREYINVMNQALDNDGISKTDSKRNSLIDLEKNSNQLPNNNWLDMIFRDGIIQNYELSFLGGGENSSFYTGLSHRKTEGILLNSYIEKTALRLNSDYSIAKNVRIGENLAITYTDGNYGIDTTNPEKGAVFTAIGTRSFHPLKTQGKYLGDNDLRNPVAYLLQQDDKRPTLNLSGNFFLEFDFLKKFTFKSKLGINKKLGTERKFKSPEERDKTTYLKRKSVDEFSWLTESTISYQNEFADSHRLDILLGHAVQRNEGSEFSALANNFRDVDSKLHFLDTQVDEKDRRLSGGPTINNSLLSLFGRLDYSFANKYYLTGIVRRDGSSKLPKENRWGTFPSLSLAWRISNESFMENVSWMSNLKLRASYGRLGNLGGLGDFDYKEDIRPKGTFTLIDGKWVDGIEYKKPRNKNLRWEESVQANIGLDGEFARSFYFTVDYFVKTTENLLLDVTLPPDKGFFSQPKKNAGKVQNSGVEVLLGYKKSYEDFNFDISTNFSFIRNEIQDLGGLENIVVYDKKIKSLDPIKTAVGNPINGFYVVETDGIFQSQAEVDGYTKNGAKIQPNAKPGDLKFVDANGDGVINSKDRVYRGGAFPDMNFGLNFIANYKRFDLSMLWQGALGVNIFNGLKFLSYRPRNDYNMVSQAKDAWTPSNTNTDIPRLSLDDPNNNYTTVSDWYLEDGSYLRLKNITLGYEIPTSSFSNSFRAKLFLTGKNLLTFTKYSGFDPEVSNTGVDVGYYPSPKSVILGVNLKF